jgi:hypothetical protein
MTLGNGQKALFWEDKWLEGQAIREIVPMLYNCVPKRRRRQKTVAEALHENRWARDIQRVLGVHEIGQYLLLWSRIEGVALSDEPDSLRWKWTADGVHC